MPRSISDLPSPPKVMTWPKASPVLAICAIVDAARAFFNMFWFFGPALAGIVCTSWLSGVLKTWTLGVLGEKTAALVCGAGATAVGVWGAPEIEMFGVIMAMAVGFAGWLAVGLILIMTDARIFKEKVMNILWFMASLFMGEVPFLNALPGLTGTMFAMYHAQIKREKELFKKYQKELAELEEAERARAIAEFIQLQNAQAAQSDIY